MTGSKALGTGLIIRKGDARPPPEPTLRIRRPQVGPRVGVTLTTDTYVAFKAFIARRRITGEQAIAAAIDRLLREG